MNEKTIEDALNLLISGELDLVDTALGEVSNIKTYAEAGILTRDSGLVLRDVYKRQGCFRYLREPDGPDAR